MVNIFVAIDCKMRKTLFVTLSARKAKDFLKRGVKIEVWSGGIRNDTIYSNEYGRFRAYIIQEKEYIGRKQKNAEKRNKRRFDGK